MVLVATKVHVPDVRPGLVAREALVARLTGGADRRLSVICAPAGWGKTVLLAQWHASERRPFAWVSLDPSDDDPVRFWSYVIAALRTVVPGFGGAVLAALPNAGPGLVDVVLPRLINELAELPEPVVLVLDDVHVLQDELVHASLAFVIRHLPRTVHLALATRAEPALPPRCSSAAPGGCWTRRTCCSRTPRSSAAGATSPGGADAELSEREVAVLRLLATDLSQREIGSQLYVSFNTVTSHTRTLFRKLGVTSRADAVARGRDLGHL